MVTSLDSYLHPFGEVNLQSVYCNFCGDTLNERWTTRDIVGDATHAMFDAVDEGFSIITATTANNRADIWFNTIRQFSNTDSVFIGEARGLSTASSGFTVGLVSTSCDINNGTEQIQAGFDTALNANFFISTGDASCNNLIATSIVIDTVFHTFVGRINSGSATLKMDGVLEVVTSSNLPTEKLQPHFFVITRTTAAKEGRIRHYEAFST